jgi:dCTP deaminase
MLTDTAIQCAIDDGTIVIKPFNSANLGSNSYDLHLSKYLAVYKNKELDVYKPNDIDHFDIPPEGFVLQPGILYLGATVEFTATHKHVPILEGKSSAGRLGIFIHATAGVGDIGFCNHWTLELTVAQPVRVYSGMSIAQILYFQPIGEVTIPYDKKPSAKYRQINEKPVGSLMYQSQVK